MTRNATLKCFRAESSHYHLWLSNLSFMTCISHDTTVIFHGSPIFANNIKIFKSLVDVLLFERYVAVIVHRTTVKVYEVKYKLYNVLSLF